MRGGTGGKRVLGTSQFGCASPPLPQDMGEVRDSLNKEGSFQVPLSPPAVGGTWGPAVPWASSFPLLPWRPGASSAKPLHAACSPSRCGPKSWLPPVHAGRILLSCHLSPKLLRPLPLLSSPCEALRGPPPLMAQKVTNSRLVCAAEAS